MIGTAEQKAHAAAVTEAQAFMHKHGIALGDLIDVGGAELKSSNLKTREKTRRVEKCWQLMARVSVSYAHLEGAPAYTPPKQARRKRGEGVSGETIKGIDDVLAECDAFSVEED